MILREFLRRNKNILKLSGVLILFAVIVAFFSYAPPIRISYAILFSFFIALPLYLATVVIDSLAYRNFVVYPYHNDVNWTIMIIGFLVNLVYIFYLSKAIIYLKNRMNKKLFIAWTVVLLFFLLGIDFEVFKLFDKPDLSCTSDVNCKADFNQYSGYWCDYSCHNNKWNYYKPVLLRVFATEPCMSPPSCKCVQNKCRFVSYAVGHK